MIKYIDHMQGTLWLCHRTCPSSHFLMLWQWRGEITDEQLKQNKGSLAVMETNIKMYWKTLYINMWFQFSIHNISTCLQRNYKDWLQSTSQPVTSTLFLQEKPNIIPLPHLICTRVFILIYSLNSMFYTSHSRLSHNI